MTKDKIKDYTLRVTNANKSEMIVILYDIALTYADDARKALESGEKEGFRAEVGHIKSVIRELMDSVNTATETGMNLLRLYIFCNGELTKAFIEPDMEPVYHVSGILSKLREAWETVSMQDESGPVMTNAEKVYSGFTYGRNSMSNDISNADSNRGYLA